MFRVMVRCNAGWSSVRARRQAWATFDDETQASACRQKLMAAGVWARVVRQENYEEFCSIHLIA